MEKTKLSVNINKVALIRNSRGGNRPNVVQVARDCENYGADGITVHPRPDERHIRYSDLRPLKEANRTEFNIEGYPSDRFMEMILDIQPEQCTLVPDPPGVLTSNSGWDTRKEAKLLVDVIDQLKRKGIRTSLFIDPIADHVSGAMDVGADRVELYTGTYAESYKKDRQAAIRPHIECSERASILGIGLNAGHDLDLENLSWYRRHLFNLSEVSIGHAIVSDAIYFGLENVIAMYRRKLAYISG